MIRIALIALIALCAIIPTYSSYAFDANIRGFIALDMLVLKKAEGQKQEVETGIGTLDLKVYATHDDFSMKIKLDLDDSRIGDAYNLFEEATVSYRVMPDHQLIMGKGKVAFHQMHWGVISSSFTDGGAELTPDHSLYDLDNRLILSWRYGGFSRGFFNYLTYFGEAKSFSTNSDGTPRVSTSGTTDSTKRYSLSYRNEKTFSSKEQAGIANKFELLVNRELSLSAAGMYYYNDINPKNNWAFDLAGRYSTKDIEIWAEYIHAFTSTFYAANYATFRKHENLLQFGAEYYMTEFYNILTNIEAAFVNNQHHGDPIGEFNDGKKVKTKTYKAELGVKLKLHKSAFITLGGQVEKQNQIIESDNSDTNRHAYIMASKFSFFF